MPADFTPTLNGYTEQSKLRFWCQKVLPLVYDDSLSYYELLNKVVTYLNNTISDVSDCEDNITALRDAFVQLQDYVNERIEDFSPEVEHILDELIDSGRFDEILANVVNGLIANEYSTTQGYAQFDYVLKDGKLYCAIASTSGQWDATKWRETTVGADMQLLNQILYNLNVCLRAEVITINENGTSSNTLTGLTANHVVGNWGMFSDSDCTSPIPENMPTCDIAISTAANTWAVTITNFSSVFYLRPTFILKSN